MTNKILAITFAIALLTGICSCEKKKSSITAKFSDKFEGKTVELVGFRDSAILNTAVVENGRVIFDNASIVEDEPKLVQLTIDGRVKAYAIVEAGGAVIGDSASVATGTPLNDKFANTLAKMDSIEDTDDMFAYADMAEKFYNENKENVLGEYFAIEWVKYADPARVDSLLKAGPQHIATSARMKKAIAASRLRLETSPGYKYKDFTACDANGKPIALSSLVKPGKYTLIDFWASWCPYCIKEMPELKEIYSEYKDKGLEIVGIAVRDKAEDTKMAVEKHSIPWNVMYEAQRIPYDIYGFSGIPHHILIGPDGVIISRGESAKQVKERLQKTLL